MFRNRHYAYDFIFQNGAQDLRIKMEAEYSSQPPTTNLSTPTSLVSFIDKNSDTGLPGGLAASIAPADMLNVWNATKLNSKGGTVNTADGKRTVECQVHWTVIVMMFW